MHIDMRTVVLKFGGASVATPAHFSRIAEIVVERKKEYERVVVVVSAMANTTDQLIHLAKQVHPEPPRREYDMLVSVGERISISLLAMALAKKQIEAISFTGSQSGIITCNQHSDAKIVEVRPHRLIPHLENGRVVIVAGFQGVSLEGEITTLGRGGSDTSAVALGCALFADRVEFYKDVGGVYNIDPKLEETAKKYSTLNFDDAINIAINGAQVLHSRCLKLAKSNGLPLLITSFEHHKNHNGTLISDPKIDRNSDCIFETLQ